MTTDSRTSSFHVSFVILMLILKVKESMKRMNWKKISVFKKSLYRKEFETTIKEKRKKFSLEERARIKLIKKRE